MKWQIWLIFMLITNSFDGVCQLTEDFSLQSSLNKGLWQGDLDHFAVENGQLRLMASGAGYSTLLHPINLKNEWETSLWFKLDFAPSNQNILRIYFWSKDVDTKISDALYMQIGETGSNDDIELYYRLEGRATLLGTGEMSKVGTDPTIARVRLSVSDKIMELSVDYTGGLRYQTEIEIPFEQADINDGFFGISCTYTSTRSDRFYFDDIYVGDITVDTVAPKLLSVQQEAKMINLSFDEPISQDISLANFIIVDDEALPISYNLSDSDTRISLLFEGEFEEQKSYQLQLIDIKDLYGNTLDTTLIFFIPSIPQGGDILLNEIMFNPIGSGADYVELINTTDKVLNIKDLHLLNADRTDSVAISIGTMLPNSYLVFTDNKINILESFPFHAEEAIIQQEIPAFNNMDGNVSISLDANLLDSFDYDEDYHNSFLDDIEGVSLERRSINQPTNDPTNWTSSVSSKSYGTPGLANSVNSQSNTGNVSFTLASRSFSPDGDGYNDQLEIIYAINGSPRVANVKIYNDAGVEVKALIKSDLVANEGKWHWDGNSDDGAKAPMGIYVIWIQLLNEDGLIQLKKLTAVLAKNIR